MKQEDASFQHRRYNRYFQKIADLYVRRPEVKTSVELLLTLLTISFFLTFAIRPTINTISSLISTIKTQEEIKEKLDQKIQALRAAQLVWQKEQGRLLILDQAIPTLSSPQVVVQQIQALAFQKGLTIKSLSVGQTIISGKPIKKDGQGDSQEVPGQFSVNITVTGDYANLIDFLANLEDLRRMITVSGSSIGKDVGQEAQGALTLTITGVARYYAENTQQ